MKNARPVGVSGFVLIAFSRYGSGLHLLSSIPAPSFYMWDPSFTPYPALPPLHPTPPHPVSVTSQSLGRSLWNRAPSQNYL